MCKVYKNILIMVAVVASLVTPMQLSAANKQTITMINNGKAGGSFNDRKLMYKEGIVETGYDVH